MIVGGSGRGAIEEATNNSKRIDYSREESRWLMGMAEANAKGSSPREQA